MTVHVLPATKNTQLRSVGHPWARRKLSVIAAKAAFVTTLLALAGLSPARLGAIAAIEAAGLLFIITIMEGRKSDSHLFGKLEPKRLVVTFVVFLAMTLVHGLVFAGAALAVEGFVLLAGLPVALDWSELESGPARAGTATGFLLLAGNLGGVVLVLFVQALIGNPYLALAGIAALGVPGVLIAARLPRHARSHLDDDRAASGRAAA